MIKKITNYQINQLKYRNIQIDLEQEQRLKKKALNIKKLKESHKRAQDKGAN